MDNGLGEMRSMRNCIKFEAEEHSSSLSGSGPHDSECNLNLLREFGKEINKIKASNSTASTCMRSLHVEI